MSVWTYEATMITDAADLVRLPIYHTPSISSFLNFDKSQVRIISGLKGTGKTLFLKLASHHYRRLGGVVTIPTNELTERLFSIDHDFSSHNFARWTSHETWKHIWRSVISIVALKSINISLPKEVLNHFPESLELSIGSHLSAAIKSRVLRTSEFQTIYSESIDPALLAIDRSVAIFIDNIDEAFARHSGLDLKQYSQGGKFQTGHHSYDLWVAAQIGFMQAVRELSARNAHLKVFGTIRAEAIRDDQTSTAFNVESLILDLRYSQSELRGIFAAKLQWLLDNYKKEFSRPEEVDPINAFFNFDNLDHPTVVSDDGHSYCEPIFDYLRRHTRGRPRELDFLGKAIQSIKPTDRTPDNIRNLVRDLSFRFFQFAKNEAVPYWDNDLDLLLSQIPSNFISQKRALEITDRISTETTSDNLWNLLYHNGLCGAVVSTHPKGKIQQFSGHDISADLDKQVFKSAKTWVLHPCVNIANLPMRSRYKSNKVNVAGHLYPYVTRSRFQTVHNHTIIGCGKLSLGLIVPSLLENRRTSILLVARDRNIWRDLLNGKQQRECKLKVRLFGVLSRPDKCIEFPFTLISDQLTNYGEKVNSALSKHRIAILVSSSRDSSSWAITRSDSIGVSVGAANFSPAINEISSIVNLPRAVLIYENSETCQIEAEHAFTSTNFIPVPCVIDRICIAREFSDDEIKVSAEEYRSVLAHIETTKRKLLPPAFTQSNIDGLCIETNLHKFEFLRNRKKYLVNSLHTAAAAIAITKLIESGADKSVIDDNVLSLLAYNMDINAQLVGLKEVLLCSVISKMDRSFLNKQDIPELVRDLDRYGEHAIMRMLSGSDVPSRVLRTDPKSLAVKYKRLLSDAENLAVSALRIPEVVKHVSINSSDIRSRLGYLKGVFMDLMSHELA